MKITPFFGVLGLVLATACGGGSDDDGGGPSDSPSTQGENNPIWVGPLDTIVPGTGSDSVAVNGNIPIPIDFYSIQNPLYKGAVLRDETFAAGRFQYVLHGRGADLDDWLAEGDIVAQRSQVGELTYAVVLSTSLRDIPATLLP